MNFNQQIAIRKLLRKNPQGLTCNEMAEILKKHPSRIRHSARSMVDAYVDRWVLGKRGQYQKIYCVVDVPEDCPHPRDRKYIPHNIKTVWQPVEARS